MKVEFIIQYPITPKGKADWSKKYGLNAYYSGKHWAQRAKDSEYWKCIVNESLKSHKIRLRTFKNPISISFYWDDKLDIDNHAVMGKMILDALKGKLVNDDNRKWVKKVSHEFWNEKIIKVVLKEEKG